MGYVVRERERRKKKYKDPAEQKVPVRFFPATDPNLQVKGKVENYAARSELDKKEGQSVKLSVSFKKSDFIGVDDATQQNREGDLRPGATITARVHCGRSVLGFYLFHELIEFVQSRMLF